MNIKNKSNPKTKNLLKITLVLIIFSFISVFGLSLFNGNQQQSNVGTSLASAQEPADINSDNTVDIVDLSILLSNWNTADSLSDINNDNTVDIVDLSILLSKWGATGSVTNAQMPTRDNTGPRYAMSDITPQQFYETKNCNKQRINGSVEITQSWMKGQTFNIIDCEISGSIYVYLASGGQQLSANEMPIINVNYTDILGGVGGVNSFKFNLDHSYIYGKVQLTLGDDWPINVSGYAPYVFSNSMLYNPYASQPTHTETLQTAGLGTDSIFTNVAFIQQGGPLNDSGVTATINYQGDGTIFDGCYFLWDGEVPAWYTVYINGPDTIVRNSWFDAASAWYVYPFPPDITPTYTNNRNYRTSELLNLP